MPLELNDLGDQSIVKVLSLLDPGDLASAELSCKRWLTLADQLDLWKHHALTAGYGGDVHNPPYSWKLIYLECKWEGVMTSTAVELSTPAEVQFQAHPTTPITCVTTLGTLGTNALLVTVAGTEVKTWRLQKEVGRQPILLRTLTGHGAAPFLYAKLLAPELLVAADTHQGWVWHPIQGTLIRTTQRVIEEVTAAVAFDHFLVLAVPGYLKVYDVFAGGLVRIIKTELTYTVRQGALLHTDCTGEDLLIAGSACGRVHIVHAPTGLLLAVLESDRFRGHFAYLELCLVPSYGVLYAITNRQEVYFELGANLSGIPTPEERAVQGEKGIRRLPGRERFVGEDRKRPACAYGGSGLKTAAAPFTFGKFISCVDTTDNAGVRDSGARVYCEEGVNEDPFPLVPKEDTRRHDGNVAGSTEVAATAICAENRPIVLGFKNGMVSLLSWRKRKDT